MGLGDTHNYHLGYLESVFPPSTSLSPVKRRVAANWPGVTAEKAKCSTYGKSRSAKAGSIEGSVVLDCDELVLDELLLLEVVVVELPLLPVDEAVPLIVLVVTTTVP